ncbi:MAG: hypothetical protein ACLQVY_16085 [Limisphaerales bacterium]
MSFLPATAAVLTNLRKYLLSHGWVKVVHPNTRIELLQSKTDGSGDYASLSIPTSPELRDAASLINEAVRLVADYESMPLQQIVDRVLRWDRDILRMRFFKVVGSEDSLPLEIAAESISNLKEFIGYAAYTHSNPQPFFDKAGAISAEFAQHCLFGHTFQGSFGLTIECPLAVVPELPMEGNEPVVPIERQVFERVANGLVILRESVAKESIDPLLAGYLTGFSANMCRKLAEIYQKADGRRIEYDIAWSPQLPTACEPAWKPFVFEGRAYDFARIAAGELEKAEKFPESVIEGRIVVLKSEMPPGLDEQAEFEHIITMFWEREKGQLTKIRVPLTPAQYMQACDAHKEGKAIRIFGVPEKAGKFWTLTKVHDFTVLNK